MFILELYQYHVVYFILLSIFIQIQKNIGPNFVAGFCVGIAFLAAVARQITLRSREHDNKGSVADLVRRGQLKSGQRGTYVTYSLKLPFVFSLIDCWAGLVQWWELFHWVVRSRVQNNLSTCAREGLHQFVLSPDPTHVGAFGNRSALLLIHYWVNDHVLT